MRKTLSILVIGATSMMLAGCASNSITGPERKFGRGMNNITEFVRGGEIRRSMEQTAIFSSPDAAYTSGFLHGLNRTIARTFVGAYEIVTFPLPNGPGEDYGPIMQPENPVYPASYKPGLIADQSFATDNHVGFSGGDVAPFIPNSRFRVFNQ
ncbi:MAG: exosortase system-associated protein, TIGR04073 family [Verrucomicrobia bacterium]|nr:exosortase system-associated protein, TIGR04073 family [Verrucomicrobiota bacterium]